MVYDGVVHMYTIFVASRWGQLRVLYGICVFNNVSCFKLFYISELFYIFFTFLSCFTYCLHIELFYIVLHSRVVLHRFTLLSCFVASCGCRLRGLEVICVYKKGRPNHKWKKSARSFRGKILGGNSSDIMKLHWFVRNLLK